MRGNLFIPILVFVVSTSAGLAFAADNGDPKPVSRTTSASATLAMPESMTGWWEARCNRVTEWVERFRFDPAKKILTVKISWLKHGGESGVVMESYGVPTSLKGGLLSLHMEGYLPHWELTEGTAQTIVRKVIGKNGRPATIDNFTRPNKGNDPLFTKRAFTLRSVLHGLVVEQREKGLPLFRIDTTKGTITPLAPELVKAAGGQAVPLTFYSEHQYTTGTVRVDVAGGKLFVLLDWATKKADVWVDGKKTMTQVPFRIQPPKNV